MIDAKDLLWNKFVSLEDHQDIVQKLNAGDCEWQKTLEDLRGSDAGVNIVVAGILNSGKSTLCNLLIGDNDNKTFETGDKEVTQKLQKYKIKETGAVVADTSGFGTKTVQDTEFSRIWRNADILVYVASVATGSIADNLEIVSNLQKVLAENPDLGERACIVSSKMGESEHADEIYQKNREIAQKLFGANAAVFLVDSLWYQEGIKNNDQDLREVSGIPVFLSWLQERLALPSRKEKIFETAKSKWLQTLESVRPVIENSIQHTDGKRKNLIEGFKKTWASYRSNILYKWESCKNLANKLKNLQK